MEKDLHIKTIAFCAVIISAICAVFWDKIFIITPLLLFFLCLFFYKKVFSKLFVLFLIFIFGFSLYYAEVRKPTHDFLTYLDNQNVIMTGKIISLPEKNLDNKTKFVFEVEKVIDEKGKYHLDIDSKTQVFVPAELEAKFFRGDKLRLDAYITIPRAATNKGEFDYKKYLANADVYTLAYVDRIKFLKRDADFVDDSLRKIDDFREKIIEIHSGFYNQEKVEILGGVVFGSEAIKPSPELKSKFIESGLYHLLAASGMNVAFIFGIWFFLLARFKVPYKFIIISGGIVVMFYALMTGLPPSVTRATWMLELALIAKLLDRTADNTVIILLVCAILLIFDPKLINDIGFLLSFIVTTGILYCTNPILDKITFLPKRISGWVIVPFIAQIFAIPVQIYYFQTISIYSIIANILVIPFMAIISFCGFIASIVAVVPKVGIPFCYILNTINEPFLNLLLFVANWISALPNNIAYVAKLNFIEISLYYILIILFIYMLKNNFKTLKSNIIAGIIFLYLVFSISTKGYSNDLTFTFLSVGEADCILVKMPNNKHIMIDAGKSFGERSNSAKSVIIPYLYANGIKAIDTLLLTHPDSDHIGGSVEILKTFDVSNLYINGEEAENKSYLALKNHILENNIKENIITQVIEISPDENVSIKAFKPQNTDDKSQNDTSLILLFKYKDFDAILMGDGELDSFSMLKQYLNPTGAVELFKVGHHGSKNSVNKDMAQYISPKVSVISVGKNSYGHPHPRVLNTLKNSRIYRTDLDNTVKIKTNGKDFEVFTYNPQKNVWKKKKD